MSIHPALEKVLCQGLGWSTYLEAPVGWVLKVTRWKRLYSIFMDRVIDSPEWENWFPEIKVTTVGAVEWHSGTGITLFSAHPLGLLDGWAIGVALKEKRPYLKLMGHPGLAGIPRISNFIIPWTEKSPAKSKQQSLRAAIQHVNEGGVLVRFAADRHSEVSMRTGSAYQVTIIPTWTSGKRRTLVGWWTWVTMPIWFKKLDGIEVQFCPLPRVEGVEQA